MRIPNHFRYLNHLIWCKIDNKFPKTPPSWKKVQSRRLTNGQKPERWRGGQGWCVFFLQSERRGFPKKLTLKIGKNAGRGELSQVYNLRMLVCWGCNRVILTFFDPLPHFHPGTSKHSYFQFQWARISKTEPTWRNSFQEKNNAHIEV